MHFYENGRERDFGFGISSFNKTMNYSIGFSLEEFDNVLEILQCEKPVYINVNVALEQFYLSTGHEPVGEEDL